MDPCVSIALLPPIVGVSSTSNPYRSDVIYNNVATNKHLLTRARTPWKSGRKKSPIFLHSLIDICSQVGTLLWTWMYLHVIIISSIEQ